jgi:GH18 family chitinase
VGSADGSNEVTKMSELSKILDELILEDGRKAYQIAEAANISPQLLTTYRRSNNRSLPWVRLEKVLAVLGYELDVMKK